MTRAPVVEFQLDLEDFVEAFPIGRIDGARFVVMGRVFELESASTFLPTRTVVCRAYALTPEELEAPLPPYAVDAIDALNALEAAGIKADFQERLIDRLVEQESSYRRAGMKVSAKDRAELVFGLLIEVADRRAGSRAILR